MSNARARFSGLTSPASFCARSDRRLPSELTKLSPESCRSQRDKEAASGWSRHGHAYGRSKRLRTGCALPQQCQAGQVSVAHVRKLSEGFYLKGLQNDFWTRFARMPSFQKHAVITIAHLVCGHPAHYVAMKTKKVPALKVRCPTCGAKPGEKCELSTGLPRTEPHRDRRLEASEK